MRTKEEKEKLDLTPKWGELLPLYQEWVLNGTKEQKETVIKTLEQLFQMADELNEEKNKETKYKKTLDEINGMIDVFLIHDGDTSCVNTLHLLMEISDKVTNCLYNKQYTRKKVK